MIRNEWTCDLCGRFFFYVSDKLIPPPNCHHVHSPFVNYPPQRMRRKWCQRGHSMIGVQRRGAYAQRRCPQCYEDYKRRQRKQP